MVMPSGDDGSLLGVFSALLGSDDFKITKDDAGNLLAVFRDENGEIQTQVLSPAAEGSDALSPNVAAQVGQQQAALAEDRRQFEASMAQRQAEFAAQMEQQARQLEEQIRQFNQQHAVDLERLSLQQDQLDLARLQGNRSDALSLAQAVANQANIVNQNLLTMAQMRQQAQHLQAQLQFQAREAQADRRFAAAQNAANRAVQLAQLTEQARQFNLQQQVEIAREIADFSRDPGDIVANIAAREQFGSISTAIAEGASGLTDEGLTPLAMLLQQQEEARGTGEELESRQSMLAEAIQRALSPDFGITETVMPTVPEPQFPELQQPDVMGLFNQFFGQFSGGGTGGTGGAAPAPATLANIATRPQEAGGSFTDEQFASALAAGADPDQLEAFRRIRDQQLATAEEGGLFTREFIAGDDSEGKENREKITLFNMPDGSPAALVQPVKGKSNAPEMQTGGLVVAPEFMEQARDLLRRAFEQAFARFQSAAPNIPAFSGGVAPVAVSAPGTPTDVQEAAAGLTAAGSGVKRRSFFEELLRTTPTGVNQSPLRRTA